MARLKGWWPVGELGSRRRRGHVVVGVLEELGPMLVRRKR